MMLSFWIMHALTTLKQLAVTLKVNTREEKSLHEHVQPAPFNVITKFAQAEKNEKQLRFQKTVNPPGRKQKMVPLQ